MAFKIGANTVIDNDNALIHSSFQLVPGTTQNTQVKIVHSGDDSDIFGISVAVGSGRIVVGEPNHSSNGAAYIFDLNGNGLTKIVGTSSTGAPAFGSSVAVGSGRIVVGALYDEGANNVYGLGAAYIFDLNGTLLYKIAASDGARLDSFGNSVAVGSGRIVVGAPGDDDNGSDSGSAYIFDLNGNQLAKIKASDGAESDGFGVQVAVGCGRIVIPAPFDDGAQINSGSAYIFDLNGTQLAKITAPDAALNDYFGRSVAVGCGRIVVGAYLDDNTGSDSGSAYIFDLNGKYLNKISVSDGTDIQHLGESVSVGSGRIVVGAPYDNDNGILSGAAYIFDLNGNQLAKIKASDGATEDYFGESVSVGSGRIVVGAYGDDDNGSASGSAYIYKLPETSDTYFENVLDTYRY
jgi:predicted amidohydrolase